MNSSKLTVVFCFALSVMVNWACGQEKSGLAGVSPAEVAADSDPKDLRGQLKLDRAQVKKIAETLRSDLRKASQYKPTEKAISTISATEEAREKLQAYCDSVYKELDQARAVGQPNQTEIIVFGPAEEELPGGYKNAREHFRGDVKFYGFKYVAPGETSGMSFDGAFKVDGKWYFLPKAHRAFR